MLPQPPGSWDTSAEVWGSDSNRVVWDIDSLKWYYDFNSTLKIFASNQMETLHFSLETNFKVLAVMRYLLLNLLTHQWFIYGFCHLLLKKSFHLYTVRTPSWIHNLDTKPALNVSLHSKWLVLLTCIAHHNDTQWDNCFALLVSMANVAVF